MHLMYSHAEVVVFRFKIKYRTYICLSKDTLEVKKIKVAEFMASVIAVVLLMVA